MAINPETAFPGKIAPSSAPYPYGEARDITVPGDGTGTPWKALLVNDIFGFQQALLGAASIVPSGSPDEVGTSQYLDALEALGLAVNAVSALPDAGRLRIGGNAITGLRDTVIISRQIEGLTDSHEFRAQSVIDNVTDSGTFGIFDAATRYESGGVLNHIYSFQDRAEYGGAGTLSNQAGFYSAPFFDGAGVVTRRDGVRILDPTGTSVVDVNVGINIKDQAFGTLNYAIWAEGGAPSIFGGTLSLGSNTSIDEVGCQWAGFTASGATQSGFRADGGVSSAATSGAFGFDSIVQLTTAVFNCTDGAAFYARDMSFGVGATMTFGHGVLVENQTKAVNNYGVRSKVSAGASKWDAFFGGGANNHFAGVVGLGVFNATALLEIKAGTAAAGTAPLKLTAGTNLTAPENGAVEFDGTNVFITVGGVRKTFTIV